MATLTLESLQNELIRDVLRVDNMDILKKVRNLLRREERKTTGYAEHVSAPSTVAEEAELRPLHRCGRSRTLYDQGGNPCELRPSVQGTETEFGGEAGV